MFKPATRKRVKARLALVGLSKSGKSLNALGIMRGIVGPEGRIAAVDTENGALSLYAGRFGSFDVDELNNCSPDQYIKCIDAAAKGKYDGLVIDSVSQEWQAILELVDGQVDKFFGGWKAATPKHNDFIRAIVAAPMHVIVTIRQKDEYVIGDGNQPRKVGLEPVQRKQFEFEFNAVMTIDLDHRIKVTHSAIEFMPNGSIIEPDVDPVELGGNIRTWLDDGDEDWVPPVFKKSFYVGEREYVSAGIERDTFIAILNSGNALDKATKKGAAKTAALGATGKTKLEDLTEEEGKEGLARIQEALVKVNAK